MKNLQTVLITGVAGFIGSHLSEKLLKNGYRVIGLDNFDSFYSRSLKTQNLHNSYLYPHFQFFELDITDKKSLYHLPKFDIVIHLAAKAGVRPSIKNPSAYIQTNIQGTNNLLELMKERLCYKMLFASSSSIYGNSKSFPFSESLFVGEPISPYAFTKRSNELMNYTYHSLYKMDIINLRFFTAYGPRQRPDLAIHKFVHKIKNGKVIEMYGDGTSARDYTYVEDIVEGICRAMLYLEEHNNVYEIINLGNNHSICLSEMIKTISEVVNEDVSIKQIEMQAGDVDITCADITKAKTLLGYQPKISFKKGIKKFVRWYEDTFVEYQLKNKTPY
ncbi:GDP-mannose 4,6-dehydratase [Limibacter armeniacum]|uniref:GDP-mannose 4,6-dehydratase n=1 Tax=Limibacter armeniacum TaxID=466084 RepID=UPI002FE55A39